MQIIGTGEDGLRGLPLHAARERAQESLLEVLDKTTMKDLLKRMQVESNQEEVREI